MSSRYVQAQLISILLTAPAYAGNPIVDARLDFTFSPQNLQIAAGDSVVFRNTGGNHNVVAGDGSFRCANGCDDSGGNGAPSPILWQFTLTFSTPGVVDYVCETHVGIGMVGKISVCTGNNLVLADQAVSTTEVFTAVGTITAGPAFTVLSTGDATLRAADEIVLGNGTVVNGGGELKVGLSATPCDTDPEPPNWIMNTIARSAKILESAAGLGVLQDVQVAEARTVSSADVVYVEATGIPKYDVEITQANVDELNGRPRAATDFAGGATTASAGLIRQSWVLPQTATRSARTRATACSPSAGG